MIGYLRFRNFLSEFPTRRRGRVLIYDGFPFSLGAISGVAATSGG